jgi:hypothetical protein
MASYSAKRQKSLRAFVFVCLPFFISCLGICSQRRAKNPAPDGSTGTIKVAPSTLFDRIQQVSNDYSAISGLELAAYGNTQLKKLGFNYDFEVRSFIKERGLRPALVFGDHSNPEDSPALYVAMLKLTDGSQRNFLIRVEPAGPCGERIASLPVISVGPQEIVLVANGRQYKVKRPSEFGADSMDLVDETMGKAIHSWEVPYGAAPAGVSADGQTPFINDIMPHSGQAVWLAISDTGFRLEPLPPYARESFGEWIQDHPTDPNNDYLSFMRFRLNGKSLIIRFSAPCT